MNILKMIVLLFIFSVLIETLKAQNFIDSLSLNSNKISDISNALGSFNSKFYDAVSKRSPISVFLLGDSHVKQGALGKSLEKTLMSFFSGNYRFPDKDSLDNTAVIKIIEEYHAQLSGEPFSPELKLANADNAVNRYRSSESNLIFNHFGVIGASYFYYNYTGYASYFAKNFRPDLYIISLGVNDCYYPDFDTAAFMAQVTEMIKSVKKESPASEILVVLPPDHFTWKYRIPEINNNILTLRAALLPWLKSQEIPWYDFFEVMGGSGSIKKWQRNKFAEGDLIHFTNMGYELWGKLLGTALINNFLHSLIRNEAD